MPRRKRSESQEKPTAQPQGESTTQPRAKATQTREVSPPRARVHADLLTVSFRGPLASQFRSLAEECGLTLAKLTQDALLRYQQEVAGGYAPGCALAEWKAEQGPAKAPEA